MYETPYILSFIFFWKMSKPFLTNICQSRLHAVSPTAFIARSLKQIRFSSTNNASTVTYALRFHRPGAHVSELISHTVRQSSSFLLGRQRTSSSNNMNFDTYNLVRQLERQGGFTRTQAVAIMRVILTHLSDAVLALRSQMVSKQDLEQDQLLFQARLSHLRQELDRLKTLNQFELEVGCGGRFGRPSQCSPQISHIPFYQQVTREIENLNNQFNESLVTLKSEIDMEMNNRKTEARDVSKDTTIAITQVNHKLILKLADVKTRMEEIKLNVIRRILWTAMATVILLIATDFVIPHTPTSSSPNFWGFFNSPQTSTPNKINNIIDEID